MLLYVKCYFIIIDEVSFTIKLNKKNIFYNNHNILTLLSKMELIKSNKIKTRCVVMNLHTQYIKS